MYIAVYTVYTEIYLKSQWWSNLKLGFTLTAKQGPQTQCLVENNACPTMCQPNVDVNIQWSHANCSPTPRVPPCCFGHFCSKIPINAPSCSRTQCSTLLEKDYNEHEFVAARQIWSVACNLWVHGYTYNKALHWCQPHNILMHKIEYRYVVEQLIAHLYVDSE